MICESNASQTNVQSPFYWLSLFSLFTLFCVGIIHPKVLFKDDIENPGTNKSNIYLFDISSLEKFYS